MDNNPLFYKALNGIGKARLLEIKIPANSTQPTIPIGTQDDLRYARILGIEVLTASDLAVTYPGNLPVLPDDNLKQVMLILETNDADDWDGKQGANGRFSMTGQNFKYIPLASFHRSQNASGNSFVRQMFEFSNIFITWEKSFLVMPVALGNTTDIAIAINVYYTFRNIEGKLINRSVN